MPSLVGRVPYTSGRTKTRSVESAVEGSLKSAERRSYAEAGPTVVKGEPKEWMMPTARIPGWFHDCEGAKCAASRCCHLGQYGSVSEV